MGKAADHPETIRKIEGTFPRTSVLSEAHSPIFWVENKDRFLRQLLIKDIEELTGRRLAVFFCSRYFSTSLTADDISRLYEIISDINGSPFDLFLETSGGETDAAEGIISMLHRVNSDFRVIVPSRAKSNGTVICLAAKEIVMGATSELGPIEPSIGQVPASILSMDDYKKINFDMHHLGKYALLQTKKLAKDLLANGMMQGASREEIENVVEKLCGRDHFYSHGSVIHYSAAKDLGLKVTLLPDNDDFWRRIWLLHNMYSHDSDKNSTGKFYEGSRLSRAIYGDDPSRREGT